MATCRIGQISLAKRTSFCVSWQGMSSREIAEELKISERSVQVLIPKILRKLGLDIGELPGPYD
jgi:DNA-directed RNA polymerase specialized sigma24 family protein